MRTALMVSPAWTVVGAENTMVLAKDIVVKRAVMKVKVSDTIFDRS
jgi:uncharacterized membrane protein YecN with MAPEG domain